MGKIIGIDLGTTFSAVAVIDEIGRPIIVRNQKGENITPSVVSFEDSSAPPLVGTGAYKEINDDRPLIIHRFKRHMGTSKTYAVRDSMLTPTDLSALVLKSLVDDVVQQIGPIAEAVVTIPANFSNEAREATMAAAKATGLNISFIINEPTAAALYYAFKNEGKLNGNYAVYDLGGGTFDISIISVKGHDVKVLTSNGIAQLGGMDFDKDVRAALRKKYLAVAGDELPMEFLNYYQTEEIRKGLSDTKEAKPRLGGKLVDFNRAEVEELISTKIAQAELLCETTLAEANLTPDKITKVLLVGGATRTPAVRESVRRVFKQEPVAEVNVDEVVALGAALYAALKSSDGLLSAAQKQALGLMTLQEVTGKSFGTFAMHSDESRGQDIERNNVIIPKNHAIPGSETKSFYTRHDNQTVVRCVITESVDPETDPQFVTVVREEKLQLPSGRPAGREIKVTYSYDDSQMMHCAFLDVESGIRWEENIVMAAAKKSQASIDKFIIE